jgi:bacterioferritin-associated ferredoxin
MVLCICKAVTERQLDAAIHAGARSLDEISARTGAGSDCGCCKEEIEERLQTGKPGPCGGSCASCPLAPAQVASAA